MGAFEACDFHRKHPWYYGRIMIIIQLPFTLIGILKAFRAETALPTVQMLFQC
jgi:hypothetical protein